LRALLEGAGLHRVQTSASFRWDGTLAAGRAFGELLAHRLALPNFREPLLAEGWADADEIERMVAACDAWSRRDDVLAAMIMCEAIGWGPSEPNPI
jgi:hypothetical protein